MKLGVAVKKYVLVVCVSLACNLSLFAQGNGFSAKGNVLIADQFNNRVIEVDRRGNIVWHFGLGPADFSPASIIGTNDAQRVGEFTLMAGTGTLAVSPKRPTAPIPVAAPTTACY